ncbi:MAG: hypothetical protein JSS51_10220 [Planctomycetes bacterium]|nr:hypothetical protein [Planctomycetota bacterium]
MRTANLRRGESIVISESCRLACCVIGESGALRHGVRCFIVPAGRRVTAECGERERLIVAGEKQEQVKR